MTHGEAGLQFEQNLGCVVRMSDLGLFRPIAVRLGNVRVSPKQTFSTAPGNSGNSPETVIRQGMSALGLAMAPLELHPKK
jgi:hypothetical protein